MKVAVNPLINALKDKDSYIRLEAAKALDKIGWKSKGGQENVYYLIAKTKWIEVSKIGKLAVFPLIQTLKDGDWIFDLTRQRHLVKLGMKGP